MPQQTVITHHRTGAVLYAGHFASTRHALEQAARDNVALDWADLARANLVNAALDGISLRRARLAGANLMGANLSEAQMDGADFTGAGLQNACLCESSLRHCRFDGALFGATDITGSVLDRSIFSTLSALRLNFAAARSMAFCVFADPGGVSCPLSQPPLVLDGLAWPVVIMDRHVKTGARIDTLADMLAGVRRASCDGQSFIDEHADLLARLIHAGRAAALAPERQAG